MPSRERRVRTTAFETWMASHEYREEHFEDPDLLETALPAFSGHLVKQVGDHLSTHSDSGRVVPLLGAGALFGLGDVVKVSALLNEQNDAIAGRLLVFFPGEIFLPGEHGGNSYCLLDARDGWNYLATPITSNGSGR